MADDDNHHLDCEGCIFPIINKIGQNFSQIQIAIIENDNPNCDSKYQQTNRFFEDSGFVFHTVFLLSIL
jgi:hypothetical protein